MNGTSSSFSASLLNSSSMSFDSLGSRLGKSSSILMSFCSITLAGLANTSSATPFFRSRFELAVCSWPPLLSNSALSFLTMFGVSDNFLMGGRAGVAGLLVGAHRDVTGFGVSLDSITRFSVTGELDDEEAELPLLKDNFFTMSALGFGDKTGFLESVKKNF